MSIPRYPNKDYLHTYHIYMHIWAPRACLKWKRMCFYFDCLLSNFDTHIFVVVALLSDSTNFCHHHTYKWLYIMNLTSSRSIFHTILVSAHYVSKSNKVAKSKEDIIPFKSIIFIWSSNPYWKIYAEFKCWAHFGSPISWMLCDSHTVCINQYVTYGYIDIY